MTTLLRRHPEQDHHKSRAALLGIHSTFVMSDHLIESPNLLLAFANSTLGFRRAFCENSNLGWGEACFGDDDDIVSRTPRAISPHPARTHHTLLQK